MKKLEEKILKTILKNNLIENGDKLVLAVSGGPDSIAMLNSLYNLKIAKNSTSIEKSKRESFLKELKQMPDFEIVVAHINHMIREEAGEDEKFVEEFCKKIDIQFFSKSIDVKKIANTSKIGLEEAGRMARYNFFDEVAKHTGANKIAIAHNKNDSVETVIMHALRGSGTYGLHGIEAKNGVYIKPLIDIAREEIEEYCKESNIEARIDKTNVENLYTRNKIRNVAIPYIKQEFNPNIIETISRLSDLIKTQDEFMDAYVSKAFKNILIEEADDKIIFDLKKFNLQEKVIKSRIILYTIIRLFGTSKGIEKIHIDDIIKLCQKNVGNKYLTPNKGIKIFINDGKIQFIKVN